MPDKRHTTETERRAYLQAMGIDVWQSQPQPTDEVAADQPVVIEDLSAVDWDGLQQRVAACRACKLHETRARTVFGVGDHSASWMVIGEAPGQEEDRVGEPFVGRAGQLLDQMLLAVGLDRNRVFITNTLKCRPPNNRDPAEGEAKACKPFLERQIDLLKPRLVLAVGRIAAQKLLSTDAPLGQLRGKVHYLREGALPLIVTYHPAYLLRSPTQKRKAWQDLCMARELANESAS